MTINGDVSGGIRDIPKRDAPVPRSVTTHTAPSQPVTRRDGVELSATGRALAREAALTPERIAEVRQRIVQGVYDQASVIDAVARRIVQSGDL